jgi:nucleoside-diphosphate-sugar epimerase
MILVTGGTGFVGRHVVQHLRQQGHPIRAIVRKGRERDFIPGDDYEIIYTGDVFVEKYTWWLDVLKGVSSIVHLAWYAEPGRYLESDLNVTCLRGTLRLAEAAIDAGVNRFVGVGSCFEYDLSQGDLSIATPLNPTTLYGACKAASYQVLTQWFTSSPIQFCWCRLFYLYGEGEDARRLVSYIRSQLELGQQVLLTKGNQIRDFLDVGVAAKMIADIALGEKQGPFNICSGIPISVRELAEKIADEYGRRDLLAFGARPHNVIDPFRVVGIRNS